MKLYRLSWHDGSAGKLLSWHTSMRDAMRKRAELRRQYRGQDLNLYSIETMEIPTDRDGLTNWLNAYFDSDNG